MIAWIFWHARRPEIDQAEYQSALLEFHERLARFPPRGFLSSRSMRYPGIPWLAVETEVYEDWYFVTGSAALDSLDDAVTGEALRDAHLAIASRTATAAAGLYGLRAGRPLPNPSRCVWLSKPNGTAYAPFIDQLSRDGAVWTRKMVLGPTPEFCVEGGATAPGNGIPALEVSPVVVRPLDLP